MLRAKSRSGAPLTFTGPMRSRVWNRAHAQQELISQFFAIIFLVVLLFHHGIVSKSTNTRNVVYIQVGYDEVKPLKGDLHALITLLVRIPRKTGGRGLQPTSKYLAIG